MAGNIWQIAEYIGPINDVVSSITTIEETYSAINRALTQEGPFPDLPYGSKSVARMKDVTAWLDSIWKSGIPKPALESPFHMDAFVDPATRLAAKITYFNEMTSFQTAISKGEQLLNQIRAIRADMANRVEVLRVIILGLEETMTKVKYAGWIGANMATQIGAFLIDIPENIGPMTSLVAAAERAEKRLRNDLYGLQTDLNAMRSALYFNSGTPATPPVNAELVKEGQQAGGDQKPKKPPPKLKPSTAAGASAAAAVASAAAGASGSVAWTTVAVLAIAGVSVVALCCMCLWIAWIAAQTAALG